MNVFKIHLRNRRMALGMSQKELAHAAGIKQGTLSAYERGLMFPRLPTLTKLCAVLGVSPNRVLTGNPEPLYKQGTRGQRCRPLEPKV